MTSRVSEGSASVSTEWPLACTTSIPTQESIIDSSVWEQHLSIQSVDTLSPGDVLEFRADGVEDGAGIDLSSSFVQLKYYVQKTAATSGLQHVVGQIAPNLGLMSGVGHFSRAELFLNNTPCNSSFDNYATIDLAQNLLTRNRADLNADAATGGWQFDSLLRNGAVGIAESATHSIGSTTTIDIPDVDIVAANMAVSDVSVGRLVQVFATSGAGSGTASENTNAPGHFNNVYAGQTFRVNTVSNATVGAFTVKRITIALDSSHGTTGAASNVTSYGLELLFPALLGDDLAGVQKPAHTLPLGRNAGALARRQAMLAGTHTGTSSPQNYPEFSFNYRPTIGAMSAKYIPSNTQILLRFQMNSLNRMFRDYSRFAGAAATSTNPSALSNYKIVYTQANLFVRKYKFSPGVEQTLNQALAAGEKIKIPNRWLKSYSQRYPVGAQTLEMRSILIGEAARRYVVWTAADSVVGGTPASGESSDQLCWESGEGQDVRQMRLTINGKDLPHRMVNQSTTSTTASGLTALGSQDYATAWEMLRNNSFPTDPGIQSGDWSHGPLKLYVFDNTLSGSPGSDNVSDPLLTNASVELRIDLSKALTKARVVGIYGVYDSEIQIDAARNVIADLS